MKHTPGAIKAAEIITGGKYGEKQRYHTQYGDKTVIGIADLIDRETAAPDLLEACQLALDQICGKLHGIDTENTVVLPALKRAIAKAKGGK